LDGKPECGHEVVVGAHPEGAVLVVGVLVDPNLVVVQLLAEQTGLGGSTQEDAIGLKERLETRDEEGLTQADLVPLLEAAVAVVEEDCHHP
jgi:hypothetical protein